MKKTRSPRNIGVHILVTISLTSLLLLGFNYWRVPQLRKDGVEASTLSGCPTQDSDTVGSPKGFYVNYDLSHLPDTAPYNVRTQVRSAMTMWDAAARASCLNIGFREVGPSEPVDLIFIVGQGGEGPSGIAEDVQVTDNVLFSATINIDVYNTNYFDPNQPGFNNVFTKAALHEVGHSLGLDHPFIQWEFCDEHS